MVVVETSRVIRVERRLERGWVRGFVWYGVAFERKKVRVYVCVYIRACTRVYACVYYSVYGKSENGVTG